MEPYKKNQHIESLIDFAISEDIPKSDVSADLCIDKTSQSTAKIIAKEDGVFFGEDISQRVLQKIDPNLELTLTVKDGQSFLAQSTLMRVSGNTQSILKAERILLNFLQHLCGISSITNAYVTALNTPKIHILDTRKTRPAYRHLEKAAVKAGGGHNHRINLSDMILLKENHLTAFLSKHSKEDLRLNLQKHRQSHPEIPIEIEVETLEELETLPLEFADYIMLDNFKVSDIQKGLDICKKRQLNAKIEVSGNITLKNIHEYKDLAIDRISIGRLTHSVKAIDLSLLIQEL